jgi:MazG nucleotide pyrophosphohydrolase domain
MTEKVFDEIRWAGSTYDGYQEESARYISYPKGSQYPFFGLPEEIGELYAIYARSCLSGDRPDGQKVLDCVGDILWNLARLVEQEGFKLEDAMKANLDKLAKRYAHE